MDIKVEAKRPGDAMLNDSMRDDYTREVYIRQAIESGLEDSKAGHTMRVSEVCKKYGLQNFQTIS